MNILAAINEYIGSADISVRPHAPREIDVGGTVISFDAIEATVEASPDHVKIAFHGPFPRFKASVLGVKLSGPIFSIDITPGEIVAATNWGRKRIQIEMEDA